MSDTKLRPLTRGDRKYLTAMIQRLADKVGASGLLNIYKADFTETAKDLADENTPMNPKMVELVINILKLLVEHFEAEMDVWFSNLLGCKPEELDKMPLDVDLDILVKLVESKEAEDFFSNALRLRNWTSALSKRFVTKKTG